MSTPLRRLGAVAVTTTALALGGALGSPAADAARSRPSIRRQ